MSSLMKFLFVVIGFSLAVVLTLWPSMQKIKEVENKARVSIGEQVIVADVADTSAEREEGLKGEKYLKTNEGMLFVFEEKGYHSFWMKGMKIPIDVIWISGNKIVGFENHVFPPSENSAFAGYESPVPVDKFLEVKGGRVDMLDVEVGDSVKIDKVISDKQGN